MPFYLAQVLVCHMWSIVDELIRFGAKFLKVKGQRLVKWTSMAGIY